MITKHTARQKHTETKQASEPDIAGTLELSERESKTTVISMLWILMDKQTQPSRDGQCKQKIIVLREPKTMLEIQANRNENAFDGFSIYLSVSPTLCPCLSVFVSFSLFLFVF